MKGFFVTATNTDHGKTLVTAGIVKYLRSISCDAVPMKPVQTGATQSADKLLAPDLEYSLKTINLTPDESEKDLMCPYKYLPACSPHLAAEMAGERIEITEIYSAYKELSQKHKVVVVEGSGGILVPINKKQTNLDLIKLLDIPVLLVAHTGLGTINNTLLSIECLKSNNISIGGIIFNSTAPIAQESEFIHKDNPGTIEKFSKIKILGNIPFLENTDLNKNETWDIFLNNTSALQNYLKEVL